MFVGRMFFTVKSARDLPLPWITQPGNSRGMGEVKPYLIIKVDDEEQARVGYKENIQVFFKILNI